MNGGENFESKNANELSEVPQISKEDDTHQSGSIKPLAHHGTVQELKYKHAQVADQLLYHKNLLPHFEDPNINPQIAFNEEKERISKQQSEVDDQNSNLLCQHNRHFKTILKKHECKSLEIKNSFENRKFEIPEKFLNCQSDIKKIGNQIQFQAQKVREEWECQDQKIRKEFNNDS